MRTPAVVTAIVMTIAVAARPACAASDLTGRVVFSGKAVPGATITATHGDRSVSTISDDQGAFHFTNLDEGAWTIRVEMRGFFTTSLDVTVPVGGPPPTVTLTMRPFREIVGRPLEATGPDAPPAVRVAPALDPPTAMDPSLITGSLVNGATSPFSQPRAVGNNRPGRGRLYNVGLNGLFGNSGWNARPFSFSASDAPAPSYDDLQLGFTLGGPLRIPWVVRPGPQFFSAYQHGVLNSASTHSALMPTTAQRAGDFSQSATPIRDPQTGLPFRGNVIPAGRISASAAALLGYYPLPNAALPGGANYQTAVVSAARSDQLQFGMTKRVAMRMTIDGSFALQRTVTDAATLFGFQDRSRQSSMTGSLNWSRRLSSRVSARLRYQLTHAVASTTPFFANRINVSGDAGIAGNDQDPADWGPPTLSFPDIAGLADVEYQKTTSTTNSGGGELLIRHGTHNVTVGGDVRDHRVNVLEQPDPRGTLTFTGAATGNALADFLLGIPATSAISLGVSETRLRGASYDAYVNDDWRMLATLTFTLGVRWEYETPFTEASGRLANLDIASGFGAAAPVLGTSPSGAVSGASYPSSLVRPDRSGIEPRLGISWRPSLGSPVVFRASYGLYRNLGEYQSLALLLAQQPPFSKTFSIQNSAATPLTLANPFPSSPPAALNTFAIDPNFRSGGAHNWQVSVQRELPASLTVIAAYFGTKGTHLIQAFLPNTYPSGAVNPCAACPSNFIYVTSNGNSVRHAAQFTLRRRLHAGFTATLQYTLSKSMDDAATFSNKTITPASLTVAQDWLNLGAERAPSSFDQRHLLTVQLQYTTGVGVTGGTLVDTFWGSLWKDWTVTSNLNAGSGLPLTPVYFAAVPGTGMVGVRPALTGISTDPREPGTYADPAAYAAPPPGTWGNAGRNSLRGPAQFSLDASIARVFRFGARTNLEWHVSATNVLNRVTFAAINTVITSPQFGRPTLANPMRTLQTSFRLRF
jgi:trimeric autotransporter adhesin